MEKSFFKIRRKSIKIFVSIILSFLIFILSSKFSHAKELTLVFNDKTYTFNQYTQTFSSPPGTPQQDPKLLKTLLSYARTNEKVRGLIPVTIGQKKYYTYFYYTGNINNTQGEIFTLNSGQEWVNNNIKGVIVLDEKGEVVKEPETLRIIFKSYASGYKFYQFPIYQNVNNLDTENPSKEMRDFIKPLTDNPIFAEQILKQYFTDLLKGKINKTRYEVALREMLVGGKKDISPEIKDYVSKLSSDSFIQAGRYSQYYKVQRQIRDIENVIKKDSRIKVLLKTPHILDFVAAFVEHINFIDERVKLLEQLQKLFQNKTGPNKDFLEALDNVIAEAKRTREEEIANNLYNFLVKNIAYDYALKEKFIEAVSKDIWGKGAGARSISQHIFASAAGNIALGLMVSNILWGMDEIYANAVNAQTSMEIKDELKKLFKEVYKKGDLEKNYPSDYCEKLASIAAFIKLCNASFYRNMAGIAGSSHIKTGLVDVSVHFENFRKNIAQIGSSIYKATSANAENSPLKAFLDGIFGFIDNWAKKRDPTMTDAINQNLEFSSAIEKYAVEDYISPPIVDYAVQLSLSMQPRFLEKVVAEAFISTVLILDVSGSMSDRWKGGVKIDSMKSAAGRIINMLGAENTLGYVEHKIGAVSFGSMARVNSPLKGDFQNLYNEISRLTPTDNTNIGDALVKGLGLLTAEGAKIDKMMVLLTDGQNNTGYKNDQILQGPVKEAVTKGIKIFTIGFGDSGQIDEGFLKEIAQRTGAQYFYALDAYKLDNVYITIGHKTGGKVIGNLTGEVAQGETVVAGTFSVPPNIIDLRATLNWPGSWLELSLKDPRGVNVEQGYPGFQLFKQARPIYAIIRNPAAGTWTASVKGIDVPKGKTSFEITTSFRTPVALVGGGMPPKEKIDWLYFLLFALIVATLGLAIAIVLVLREKRPHLFMRKALKK